jgi:Protein of unknown function (DUF1579)
MRVSAFLGGMTLAICAAPALAQTAQDHLQPPPELRKLDYFAGTWHLQGEMKASPYGPAGKISSVARNHWMSGGYFLISDSTEIAPTGPDSSMAIFGYDPDEKVYTYHSINSLGESEDSKGVMTGDSWSWVNETKMNGKVTKGRFSAKEISATSYTFKFEMTTDDGDWQTIMEGTAKKEVLQKK